MTSLLRIRVLLAAAAMTIIAAAAGGVFDRWVWSLVIPVALPTLISLVFRSLPLVVRALAAVLGVGASIWIVVAIHGGTTGDGVDAVLAGAQRLLTTEWPSPLRPDLIGAIAFLLAVATALATGLAARQRTHLAAWVPILASFVSVVALSAPLGTRLLWLIPLGVIATVFAALRPESDLADRWAILRGERRLIPLVLVAGIVAAAISLPVALAVRADPRRKDPPAQTAAVLDPIEATLALHKLDPTIDLHEITMISDGQPPTRWRTAALSNYDGQRWTPSLTLRPIGRRLGPDSPTQIEIEVRLLDDDLALVPLPGSPIIVEAPVETDADRTVVLLAERRGTEPVAITAEVAPTMTLAQASGIASRPIDDSVTSLSEFATIMAGDGTVLEQLRRIESTMHDSDDWILQTDAPGGGLQRALIERFLRDTQRGTAEQFATSYVLLARSLGVDARVATGFVASAPPVDGKITLTSADAQVWPEVRLLNGGWVAFDPVPSEEVSDLVPPPDQPAVQTPAAAQPPIVPPPEVSNDSNADDELTDDLATRSLSALQVWAQRVGLGLAVLLLPILVAMLVILGLKRRRRNSLLHGPATKRVAGAFTVAADLLVDAGMTISPAATNGDIAASGSALVIGAERELQRLAALSSAVTFGHPVGPDLLAEDAATCLGHVETTMAADRTRIQRLKWQLSLRSVRRKTRSPLSG